TRSHASPKTHTPLPQLQERGHRFYSTQLSRWVSRDPIGEKIRIKPLKSKKLVYELSRVDPNLYGFVKNQPLLYFDPLGLEINVCCARDVGAAAYTPAQNFWPYDPDRDFDAPRHCYVGCQIGKICNVETGTAAGVIKEIIDMFSGRVAESRDYWNTRWGAQVCSQTGSCKDCCDDAWNDGDLQ
ncbi:MAG: RHS repeat-associated core domain-containing protein, partial [bacterium]